MVQAFDNAMTVLMALGGSTNGVLHLLALAREAEVPLSIDDFNVVADRVPLLSNLTPGGEARPRCMQLPLMRRSTMSSTWTVSADCRLVPARSRAKPTDARQC